MVDTRPRDLALVFKMAEKSLCVDLRSGRKNYNPRRSWMDRTVWYSVLRLLLWDFCSGKFCVLYNFLFQLAIVVSMILSLCFSIKALKTVCNGLRRHEFKWVQNALNAKFIKFPFKKKRKKKKRKNIWCLHRYFNCALRHWTTAQLEQVISIVKI